MMHWTKITFPSMPGLLTPRVAGIRLHIEGSAWCYLELRTNTDVFFYGAPVFDNWLAPRIGTTPLQNMRFIPPQKATAFFIRDVVYPTVCILHHQSANGNAPYTIHDFSTTGFYPDDFMDITPFRPVSPTKRQYKPSRVAHTTRHKPPPPRS